ncbi:MAG: recombinase family protein [Candidatus Thiodiazotropha sp. (ex. Lucinisca nassula)]|nr:recombinase family protein [Candidatus Thiodiazotropha sp. (ex. Lucinisca nassula)]
MRKKAKDGTYRGNPDIHKHSKKDLSRANQVKQSKADEFADKTYKKIEHLAEHGASLQQIVDYLDVNGIKTRRGKSWTKAAVSNLIKRYRRRFTLERFL